MNVLSLLHGMLDLFLSRIAVFMGWSMAGVIGALGVSAILIAIATSTVVVRYLRPCHHQKGPEHEPSSSRIWKLSGVTYLRDLSLYFATPAFASPVLLTTLGGPEPVALFATSYFMPRRPVTLRRLWLPGRLPAGFRTPDRCRRSRATAPRLRFDEQGADSCRRTGGPRPDGDGGRLSAAALRRTFAAAVPVARALVVLLFAETAMAVGLLVLWVDERYRPVLGAQLVMIAGAPLFVWTAGRFGLLAAALVLGGSRLASSIFGYLVARRAYGVRYPWAFAGGSHVRFSA